LVLETIRGQEVEAVHYQNKILIRHVTHRITDW